MARKWDSFFRQVQRILKRGMRVVGLGIAAAIATISLQLLPGKAERIPHPGRVGLQEQNPPTQAETAGDRRQFVAQNLGENPLELYKQGRFTDAIALWQEQLAEGDDNDRALVLNYLSLAYQQLGKWEQAQSAIEQSQSLLNAREDSNLKSQQILARVFSTKARLLLARGDAETALPLWQKAEEIYAELGDEKGAIGSKINQAQAMQNLGLYRQALNTLEFLHDSLDEMPDSSLKVTGLRSLGNTYRFFGALENSEEVLNQSMNIARQLEMPQEEAASMISLGDTKRALGHKKRENPKFQQADKGVSNYQESDSEALEDYELALGFYQKAAKISPAPLSSFQARLNHLSLLVENQQWVKKQMQPRKSTWHKFEDIANRGENMLPELQELLNSFSNSRTGVYAQINLARNLAQLKGESADWQEIDRLLRKAVEYAEELSDDRAKAYAVGTRGWLHEQMRDWSEAETLTTEAIDISKENDLKYQWQWQKGRILREKGERKEAIEAYTEAVNTLQKLRPNVFVGLDFAIGDITPNVQLYFQEKIEPVYRELIDLLLPAERSKQSKENIYTAIAVMELLQETELENFLRCEPNNNNWENIPANTKEIKTLKEHKQLIEKRLREIDNKKSNFALIYTIILEKRLVVVAIYKDEEIEYFSTALNSVKLEHHLAQLMFELTETHLSEKFKDFSQELYNWLFKDIKRSLQNSNIETLVFVLDGYLRNIPMAALYSDTNKYLIESYALAITQGIQFLNLNSSPLELPKIMVAGLSKKPPNTKILRPLPNVEQELEQIKQVIPNHEDLLNQQFTSTALKNRLTLSSFPIVHIATHGQFSSNPEDTLIYAWDQSINVHEVKNLLQSSSPNPLNAIDLLVLSACETAQGDRRAVLGLAGIAERSGARSTVASLWRIDDQYTARLIGDFYRELLSDSSMTKAKALQKAQIDFLKKEEVLGPYFWAPYILVGNWL